MAFFEGLTAWTAAAVLFAAVESQKRLTLGSTDIAGQFVHVVEVPGLPSADLEARCDGQRVLTAVSGFGVPVVERRLEVVGEFFGDSFEVEDARALQVVLDIALSFGGVRGVGRWPIHGVSRAERFRTAFRRRAISA